MNKIKIVFVHLDMKIGGVEKTLLTLLEYLPRDKFNITLILGEKKGKLLNKVPTEVQIFYLSRKLSKRLFFLTIKGLFKVIYKIKPNIIFCCHGEALMQTYIVNLFFRKKLIFGISGILAKGKFHWLYSLIFNTIDLSIAVSEKVYKDVIKLFKVKPQRMHCIYNGIDFAECGMLSTKKAIIPQSFVGYPIILSTGRLVKTKRFHLLLEGFKKLLNYKYKVKLVIVGNGPERVNLKNLAEYLNIEQNLYFTGSIINPYPYFKLASLFVLTSKREGLSNVLIEAMALNVPVIIASDCQGGPLNLIKNGQTGYLVTPDPEILGKKMFDLLTRNKKELNVRAHNAKVFVRQNFSAEAMVRHYEEVFLSFMN